LKTIEQNTRTINTFALNKG